MSVRLILLGLLAAWNLTVFLTYAVDKRKAVKHRWRIPERRLLAMSYVAGGVGALLAGKLVHHKTRKWYFWTAWIIGLLVDGGLIYGIFKL